MQIYDISQEVFSCAVYAGDPAPEAQTLCSLSQGAVYTLSAFSMCAHNGTHIDAPAHFLREGKTVEQIPLESFVGPCHLLRYEGELSEAQAREILQRRAGAQRLLLAGPVTVTAEAARIFAASDLKLLGNEGQTVGPEDAPMEVHKILLEREIVLLEGIVLTDIPEGPYFLNAAPLNLSGLEGAPCRAYLIGPLAL
ncbi:MAG: cyclase family protein [Oscillospiraceae bacterium]|nr:cyclase family protein [Oscillospiraceae bacterium]